MNFDGTPPSWDEEELEALKSDPYYGEKKYPNGDFYQGILIKGRKHGLGKYTFSDGGFSFGGWEKGIACGNVRIFYETGDIDEKTQKG